MLFNNKDEEIKYELRFRDVTIQVTGDCNLACTYCYLHDKNTKMLDVETGKRFIEKIVTNDQSFWNGYYDFSDEAIDGIKLQFIGGEPLVNYKAIIELCDYFKECCEKHNRLDFYNRTPFGICTNGTIYNEEIAEFLRKYYGKIDISISIDGNKELHDTCRRYKGSNKPSYDIVVANLEKFRKALPACKPVNTKATLSPENIHYIYDSVVNMFEDLKFKKVPMNCVHEDVWCLDDAKILYNQMKKTADWILEKGYKWEAMDLTSPYAKKARQLGLFSDSIFGYFPPDMLNKSWCGGNGHMTFLQCDGKIYNCNRYSETSIGNPERDLVIGTIDTGITNHEAMHFMRTASRSNTYPQECIDCPIAVGCSDCLALYYEIQGHFGKMKNLCDMHKARYLANVYFWNKYYIQHNEPHFFLLNLSDEECLKYVSQEELEILRALSNGRYVDKMIDILKIEVVED